MANTTIQLKYGLVTAAPTALNVAEPAYSYSSNTFFIGSPDGTGVVAVGGKFYLDQQQTIFNQGNSAFAQANSAAAYANSAFLAANNASDLWVRNHANGAFAAANSAGSYANSGFTQANTATTNAATADVKAVSAGTYANGAFAVANTDVTGISITAADHGSASAVAAFRVEANGRISSANSTAIAIAASAITSGTLGVTRGGTGAGTFTSSGVLLGAGTSAFTTASSSTEGHVLTINASGVPTFSHLQGGTF